MWQSFRVCDDDGVSLRSNFDGFHFISPFFCGRCLSLLSEEYLPCKSILNVRTSLFSSPPGGRFKFEQEDMLNYKTVMRLTINPVTKNDYGTYKCVSRNSLGETEGSIKLYRKDSFLLAVNETVVFGFGREN